jgi:hypothetical protein
MNLVNWIHWTQVGSTGTNSVIDTNAAVYPRRFYRTRRVP